MSMRFAAPLQTALYARLTSDLNLTALHDRIFDDAPHRSADVGGPYVTIGDEQVAPWNTGTDRGALHQVVIRVYSPVRGFLAAKTIAADICDAILDQPLPLLLGHVANIEFESAATQREEQGALRRIDLTFRFVIEDATT